jgi:hypothetical protein
MVCKRSYCWAVLVPVKRKPDPYFLAKTAQVYAAYNTGDPDGRKGCCRLLRSCPPCLKRSLLPRNTRQQIWRKIPQNEWIVTYGNGMDLIPRLAGTSATRALEPPRPRPNITPASCGRRSSCMLPTLLLVLHHSRTFTIRASMSSNAQPA